MSSELRRFGMITGTVWGVLSLIFWLKQPNAICVYFFGFSLFLLMAGLIRPGLLTPIHNIWKTATNLLAGLMSQVILGAIFFLVVTPMGLILRLLGKDFLSLKKKASVTTYWIPKDRSFSKIDYERQF